MAEPKGIQIIPGDTRILLIAPHGKKTKPRDDINTDKITREAVKMLGCSGIVNAVVKKDAFNYNSISDASKDKKFIKAIEDVIKADGPTLVVWIHGADDQNIDEEAKLSGFKIPEFVITALIEQRKRTWNENDDNFVFTNRGGRSIHRHTLNTAVIKPTLEKLGITAPITIKDTRVSFITNSLDQNERLGFIQKQVGHSSTRMIVDHYYRHIPTTNDGTNLENAWNSTSVRWVGFGTK